MRKFFAIIFSILSLCMSFSLAACSPEEPPEEQTQPLTQFDCFQDLVMFERIRHFSEMPVRGENLSLAELAKEDNQVKLDKYSYILIHTTDKAAQIEVKSISFDLVSEADCLVSFSLELGENNIHYSSSVNLTANVKSNVEFTGIAKRWSTENAGKSELQHVDATNDSPAFDFILSNTKETRLKIELLDKTVMENNSYKIQNLQIIFEEIK